MCAVLGAEHPHIKSIHTNIEKMQKIVKSKEYVQALAEKAKYAGEEARRFKKLEEEEESEYGRSGGRHRSPDSASKSRRRASCLIGRCTKHTLYANCTRYSCSQWQATCARAEKGETGGAKDRQTAYSRGGEGKSRKGGKIKAASAAAEVKAAALKATAAKKRAAGADGDGSEDEQEDESDYDISGSRGGK